MADPGHTVWAVNNAALEGWWPGSLVTQWSPCTSVGLSHSHCLLCERLTPA